MEKNLGHATAYGYAKSKGYSGTEDEFAQLMADYASVGQSAAQSAEQAAASATSASGSATTAASAAQTATSKASEAVTAAGTATTKASEASASSDTASAAATFAGTSAQTAATAATTATAKASEASESATTATTAKTDAETARDAAAQSASEAAESARTLTIDDTLTQSGQAADSKVVGDRFEEVDIAINGLDIDVNFERSQDGKNYGARDFYFPIFKGQEITITNNQARNNNWSCTLKNSENETLANFNVEKGVTKTITVQVDNVAYMRVYQNVYPLVGKIVAESVDAYQNRILESVAGVVEKTTDIVSLNYSVPEAIEYAKKYSTTAPLALLHFSDPHGSSKNVSRMVEMGAALGSLIDDVICTGDMVNDKYTDGYAWWGDIDGAENILTCIGNHDVTDGSTYSKYVITPEEAYGTYFAPYINHWNVEHTGSLTYYYKDYVPKKIRLIVLDYLLENDAANAQNTWLQATLSGAKTNGYTVVIAQHCPVSSFSKIACNFTMIDSVTPYQYPTIYQQSVQSFIDGGGKFACYIAGHTHFDMLCINPNFPNQICINVTCATTSGRDNDQLRKNNTKSQDAANVVIIDTDSNTIKLIRVGADKDKYLRERNALAVSYSNKSIITEH